MKLILEPVGSFPPEPLVVPQFLVLSVGREDPFFAQWPNAQKMQLCVRHARLFSDQDKVYVVDLNSENGTEVNSMAVTMTPREVRSGDRLTFAKVHHFIVRISEDAAAEDLAIALSLQAVSKPEFRPLLIESSPFLVGKQQPILEPWREGSPDTFRFLSRRHALIHLRSSQCHLEDLQSTNGTWLNGLKVPPGQVPLKDDDVVAFGQKSFEFRVHIQKKSAAKDIPEGTILVSRADSFLDAYCDGLPQYEAEASSDKELSEGEKFSRSTHIPLLQSKWFPGALLSLLALLLIIGFWLGSQEDHLELAREALAAGDLLAAETLLQSHLAEQTDDSEASDLLETVVQLRIIPLWLERQRAGEFIEARALLETGPATTDLERSLDWRAMLLWMTRAAGFSRQTQSFSHLVLFQDELVISQLLDDPNKPSGVPSPEIAALLEEHEGLESAYRESLTLARLIEDKATTWLDATERTQVRVAQAAQELDPVKVQAHLAALEAIYPGSLENPELSSDLRSFEPWALALQNEDLAAYFMLPTPLNFSLPPFRSAYLEMQESLQSVERLRPAWRSAMRLWSEGSLGSAMQEIQGFEHGIWGQSAATTLDRWSSLSEQWSRLEGQTEITQQAEILSTFFLELDPERDVWLYQQAQQQLQSIRGAMGEEVKNRLIELQASWSAYDVPGRGINSTLRLEPVVSSAFRRAAADLRSLDEGARDLWRLRDFLSASEQVRTNELVSAIQTETERQYQALLRLGPVLAEDTLREKLAALPVRGTFDE